MQPEKIKNGFWKRMLFFGLLNVSVFITLYVLSDGELISILPILLLYSCSMPFISLLFSKHFAKKAFNLYVLQPKDTYDLKIEWYKQKTISLAKKAGIKKIPEIAIYESDDMNAFATGHSKNTSLVAISTGLLYKMDREGVEAVIAHEIAHISNGDMVTQTLLQSFLNIIVSTLLLPLTVLRWFFLIFTDSSDNGLLWVIWVIEFISSIILLFIAGLIAKMYSRKREFEADYLASKLTHPNKMISALQQLESYPILTTQQKKFAALQFNGKRSWLDIFSTHPSTERRINYIRKKFQD